MPGWRSRAQNRLPEFAGDIRSATGRTVAWMYPTNSPSVDLSNQFSHRCEPSGETRADSESSISSFERRD